MMIHLLHDKIVGVRKLERSGARFDMYVDRWEENDTTEGRVEKKKSSSESKPVSQY